MNRKILLEWPDLGFCVRAELADDKNQELCNEIWNALPISSIINNAVVTDGSMYCWVPLLSYAPIHVRERIDRAPIGRLRYSQNTGNKIIIQYGNCNEDIMGSVLGQVDEQDIKIIKEIGKYTMESIFMTKKELHVKISRLEGIEENAKPTIKVNKPKFCRPEVGKLVDEILENAMNASISEPDEHKIVRTGKNAGMGSCGQYFSTWEFVYSLLRDLSMFTLYPISKMCRDDSFDVRQLEKIYMEIESTYTNLLGSYGLRELRQYSIRVRKLIELKNLAKDEFTYIVDALTLYTNMIAQWAYFYYPWGIGCSCFRFDEEDKNYTIKDEIKYLDFK